MGNYNKQKKLTPSLRFPEFDGEWEGEIKEKDKKYTEKIIGTKDIKYELHLLFSSEKIISVIEKNDESKGKDKQKFGNIVNLFKDSVYLHSRNLLNTLTNNALTEIGSIPENVKSDFYKRVKQSIERYVTHLNGPRNQKGVSNSIEGEYLYELTHKLVKEVRNCMQKWIDSIPIQEDRETVKAIFDYAKNNSNGDKKKFIELMKVSK